MKTLERFVNLGSSSHGNCYYLEFNLSTQDEPYVLLLEAGFSYNELVKRFIKFDIDLSKIDGCLISHEHKDHSIGGLDLMKRGIKTFGPQLNCVSNVIQPYQWFEIHEGVNVMALPLEHYDIDKKVETYGFIIDVEKQFTMLYFSDTKYLPQDLSKFQFDLIIAEANYIEDKIEFSLLEASKNKDKGSISRYRRLMDSHMSVENLARTLDGSIKDNAKPFDLSKTQLILLVHLSSNKQTNTTYYKELIKNYLNKTKDKTKYTSECKVYIAKKEGGIE